MRFIKRFFTKKDRPSKLLRSNGDLGLYLTHDGLYFWLDPSRYLHNNIIQKGVFEPLGTELTRNLVKPGDTVFDIGANIGYYTILFSKIVGPKGRVIAFEPTHFYRNILDKNVRQNQADNVEIIPYGLSDHMDHREIAIGNSSATMHWSEEIPPSSCEIIQLKSLDTTIEDLNINSLAFIKVDIDGHEPFFLRGALKTIKLYSPVILMEISHENYLESGITAWNFYHELKEIGFNIYSEKTRKQYCDLKTFLKECGNFAYSANIILSLEDISSRIHIPC